MWRFCVFFCSLTKWNEVCSNVPYALREVLVAWEYGVIGKDTVQVRSLMHFI